MTFKERRTKAIANGRKLIERVQRENDAWMVIYNNVNVAISYGKLQMLLLFCDQSHSMVSFIEDYTDELNGTIDEVIAKNAEINATETTMDN